MFHAFPQASCGKAVYYTKQMTQDKAPDAF